LQDDSEFAATRTDEFNMYAALDKYEAGTTIYFYDYDGTRSFDKFKTSETDPGAGVLATVTLSKVDGKYLVTFTNISNTGDTNSPMTHEVMLTYGGGVYKQRPITAVDDTLFMLPLQFNARGDEASPDRTRKQWRDYHMDWWVAGATDAATMTFKTKPAAAKSVDVNCAPCHFNGYSVTEIDGYPQATGVVDVNGETHPATGTKQELNIGCETCHGPGSEHVAADGLGLAIVTPQNLAPERESIICGQCHARAQGNGALAASGFSGGDATLDASNKMMVAGTSRAVFLASNTSINDSKSGNMWADGLHSKAHHQQYTDFIQSGKYRNGTKLMTCSSCHDLHAPGTGRHQLSGATDGTLCVGCHDDVVIADHQTAKVGTTMGTITCIQCHNTKTAGSGAGSNQTAAEGFTGASGALYLHGDITSHRFDVPTKDKAVAQKMPVPYTAPKLDNTAKCGLCHGTTGL
jgi:predicted CXXCH cytochrome family protein